jgi:hypothetical protein
MLFVVEPLFLLIAVIGVTLGIVAVTQTYERHRDIVRSDKNGALRKFTRMRVRQEANRLAVQCLFLMASVLSLLIPQVDTRVEPDPYSWVRGLIIILLILIEVILVTASFMDQWLRRELLDELETIEVGSFRREDPLSWTRATTATEIQQSRRIPSRSQMSSFGRWLLRQLLHSLRHLANLTRRR